MASIASWARVEIDLDSGSRLRVGRQRKTRPAKPERAQFTPRLVALPRSAGLDHRPPKGLDIGRHASRPGAGDNLPDQAEGALLVGGQDVEPVGIVTLIHSYSGGHLAVSSTAFRAASTAVASASRALRWRTSLPVSLAASLSLSAMSLSSSSRFFSRPANSRRMSSQDRAALSLCFSSEARSASFVNTWRKTGFPYNWAISSTAACILLSIVCEHLEKDGVSVQLGNLLHCRLHLVEHLLMPFVGSPLRVVLRRRRAGGDSIGLRGLLWRAVGRLAAGPAVRPQQRHCRDYSGFGFHGMVSVRREWIATTILTRSTVRRSRLPLDFISNPAIPTPGMCSAVLTNSTIAGQSDVAGESFTKVPIWNE